MLCKFAPRLDGQPSQSRPGISAGVAEQDDTPIASSTGRRGQNAVQARAEAHRPLHPASSSKGGGVEDLGGFRP